MLAPSLKSEKGFFIMTSPLMSRLQLKIAKGATICYSMPISIDE